MNKHTSIGSKIFDNFNILFLLLLVFATLYPIYYILIVSISDGNLVTRGLIKWVPMDITFDAYKIVLSNPDIWRTYGNTLLYTTVGTTINVIMTALCAYPLSRKDFYGRGIFIFMVALTMFISGGLIPTYLVVQKLGLVDTMWALVLPPAISTFNMIIMKTYFEGIPMALQESAYLDGANEIQVLFKIIIPLSLPVMATMVLFYSVHHWNSFFPALIYLNDSDKFPVQVLLRNIVIAGEFADQTADIGSASSNFRVVAANYKFAVIIITILPILVVYPYLQKYFVKGAMIGALKG
ncbi:MULTISPECIES: carbohydrate ABC transporter permease [unclassified Paenibacillus]|uniref:carbohydrate ABC transporter permease n=1 Tax=unclassified Paenibacillus TaxID=185978 RepID=UPI0027885DCE|nr:MULTISPECIES: carbohydrate ABC transporter permease [unclassified Paenibacillus]MDQ0896910.1 putative aldouronate transport system permease protein [Paenibacillus sp. V4I7]MDQ0916940.1 putative aldouronate transport system permease protein [Paenibacillus sp. V4I5]